VPVDSLAKAVEGSRRNIFFTQTAKADGIGDLIIERSLFQEFFVGQILPMFDELQGKQDIDGEVGTTIVVTVQGSKGRFIDLAKTCS